MEGSSITRAARRRSSDEQVMGVDARVTQEELGRVGDLGHRHQSPDRSTRRVGVVVGGTAAAPSTARAGQDPAEAAKLSFVRARWASYC